MKVGLGQDGELALDCVQPLGRDHVFVQGWFSWRHGQAMPALGLQADGLPLECLAEVLYDRQDVARGMSLDLAVRGFILVARRPPGADAAAGLFLAAGIEGAALPDSPLGAPVAKVLARQPWGAVSELMAAATRDPRLGALLAPGDGRDGALGGWIAALPCLPVPLDNQHGFVRVEAIASPMGECAICLALPRPLLRQEALRVVALLPDEGGLLPVALEATAPLREETRITFYGRLPERPGLATPRFDVIVELCHPEGGAWFRATPALHAAPRFLDRLQGLLAAGEAVDGFAWLRGVLEVRHAAFDQGFAAALSVGTPEAMPGDAPVVALLHAMDDPFAARLVQLAAREIEARADEVILLGTREAGAAAADIFLQRGRVPVRVGLDLAAAVRRGTYARAWLAPIEPVALAEALEQGGLDRLFARRIDGAALGPALRLAAAAGSLEGGEAIAGVAQILGETPAGWEMRPRGGRMPGAMGLLVAEHLAALWRDAAPALRARSA